MNFNSSNNHNSSGGGSGGGSTYVHNDPLSIPTSKRIRRKYTVRKIAALSEDVPVVMGSIPTTTTGSSSVRRSLLWVNDDGTPLEVHTEKPGLRYYKVRSCERQPFVAWLKKMAANNNQEVAEAVHDLKLRFCTIPKSDWKGWYNCFVRQLAKERAERLAKKSAEREMLVQKRASIVALEYRNQNFIVPAVLETRHGGMTGKTHFPTTAAVNVKYYPVIQAWVERAQSNPNTTDDLILEDGTIVWKRFLTCWTDHWLSRMQRKYSSRFPITIEE